MVPWMGNGCIVGKYRSRRRRESGWCCGIQASVSWREERREDSWI
jgi:hypothetical protein